MKLRSYQRPSKVRGRNASDDIDSSVKLGTTMTMALRRLAFVLVLLKVLDAQMGPDEFKAFPVVSVVVSIVCAFFLH